MPEDGPQPDSNRDPGTSDSPQNESSAASQATPENTEADRYVKPLGLIAGGGDLPTLMAHGATAAGRPVYAIGLAGYFEPELPLLCTRFKQVGLIQLGRWINVLKRWGVTEAVMVGTVEKSVIHGKFKWFYQMPDARAIQMYTRTLRHDRRSQALLGAVAGELKSGGIELIDSTRYIPDHLATPGLMGRRSLTRRERSDIKFGWPMLLAQNEMDIGQAMAVRDKDVLAVEASEGTKAMIARTTGLARSGGWVMLKGCHDGKDLRFDVPTVGVQTIKDLREGGCSCLALRAGRTIMIDKPRVLKEADEAGIAVFGVD